MRGIAIIGLGLSLTACGGGNYADIANTPPQAFITASETIGFAPLVVSFDGQRSSDQDGYITEYAWNFGDGSTATDMQVNHTFNTAPTGAGSFGPGTNISTDSNDSTSAVLGDVDGDGDLDLVVGNTGAPNRLYLNDGAGNFTGSNITSDANHTTSVTLGYIDGDSFLDLIVGNTGAPNRLYLNNGAGNFLSGIDISSDSNNTSSVALGDIDGVNGLDLIVGNAGTPNRLYINDGAGNFTGSDITSDSDNTTAVVLGDVDGDMDLDLVVGNSAHSGRITAATNTTPVQITSTGHSLTTGQQISIANTGYGIDDADYTITVIDTDTFSLDSTVATSDRNGVITAITNTTPIQITSAGHGLTTGQILFITNTGIPDFEIEYTGYFAITAIDTNTFSLDGTVAQGSSSVGNWIYPTGTWAYSINRVYLNNGMGGFNPGSNIAPADHLNTRSVVLGDVNNDFNLDLLTGNTTANRLYLGVGNGTFSPGIDITNVNKSTYSLALDDIDNDSDLDVIAGNYLRQPNQVFINDGSGTFSQGPIAATESQNTRAIVTGDVDGDGNPDIIAINDGVGSSGDGDTNRLSLNGSGYTVTLTVTDNEGATATAIEFINVSGN